MWIIYSGRTKESWLRRYKNRLPDTSRNPRKNSPSGTTKDNVKSRENQEKSDNEFPNDAVIIWKLPVGKTPIFPGSRAEENFEKQEDFYENRTYKEAESH